MRILTPFVAVLLAFTACIVAITFSAGSVTATPVLTSKTLKSYPPPPPSCSGPNTGHGAIDCSADRPAFINVETAPPTFIKSVKNGKHYLAGSGNDTIDVLHLYSETDDLYDMGFALGQMMPTQIGEMWNTIQPWLLNLLEQSAPWLPKDIADIVIKDGVSAALDFVYELVAKHIPAEYYREWEGMAAGANCSIEQIKRVAFFPQVSKAACTAFSAVGPAAKNNGAYQLRALDFAPTSYVSQFSTVIIYHYKTKPMLANFGYLSLTGCLTCLNYDGKGVISGGEKRAHETKNHTAFLGLPIGFPWTQMFRKAMEFDNIPDINNFIAEHSKIRADGDENSIGIHLVFTDGKAPPSAFNLSQTGWILGYNYSQQYSWNYPANTDPLHPTKPGLLYFTKNSKPKTNCTTIMIESQYNNIDAEWFAMYYSPNDMTGDTQMVAFDDTNMKAYVANSRKPGADGPLCAYYRQRTLLDMKALFDETQ